MKEQPISSNVANTRPPIQAFPQPCRAITVSWHSGSVVVRKDSLGKRVTINAPPPSYLDRNVTIGVMYSYWLNNNPPAATASPVSCSSLSASYLALILHDTSESKVGSFGLLAPRTAVINYFLHEEGAITEEPWKHAHTLKLPTNNEVQDTGLSLIQSTEGNLDAVARVTQVQGSEGDFLVGYEFAQRATDWGGPFTLIAEDGPINGVTGSQALIQSDESNQDQFELLVPRGTLIYHYRHQAGSITQGPWQFVATLPPLIEGAQITAVSATQSTDNQRQPSAVSLIKSITGRLEAIARVTQVQGSGGDFLVGYEFEDQESGWRGPFQVVTREGPIDGVTGSQAFVLSGQGLELAVPRGALISHYRHESNTLTEEPWQLIATLNPPNGEVRPVSVSLSHNTSGKLELVARQTRLDGEGEDFFVGYQFDPASSSWTEPVNLVADDGPIVADDSASPTGGGDQTFTSGRLIALVILIIVLILIIIGVYIRFFYHGHYF